MLVEMVLEEGDGRRRKSERVAMRGGGSEGGKPRYEGSDR